MAASQTFKLPKGKPQYDAAEDYLPEDLPRDVTFVAILEGRVGQLTTSTRRALIEARRRTRGDLRIWFDHEARPNTSSDAELVKQAEERADQEHVAIERMREADRVMHDATREHARAVEVAQALRADAREKLGGVPPDYDSDDEDEIFPVADSAGQGPTYSAAEGVVFVEDEDGNFSAERTENVHHDHDDDPLEDPDDA